MNPEFIIRMRVAVLAIFLAGMPVLALPQVNDWLGQRLFGNGVTSDVATKPAASSRLATSSAGSAPVRSTHTRTPDSSSDTVRSASISVGGAPAAEPRLPEPRLPESRLPESGLPESGVEAAHVASGSTIERLPPAEFEVAGAKYGRLQARLRELGADYWRLETTGAGAAAFRFECHLPLPDHDSYSRPFAAESTDPLDAMQRVVVQVEQQVEKWQAARTARRAAGAVRR